MVVDLGALMNPAPLSVQEECPLGRVYRIFRAMGMRHLIVVSEVNTVRGIITRKNLTMSHHDDADLPGMDD